MANTLNNTLNKVGNAIETIFGSNSVKEIPTKGSTTTGQTCLERYGIMARKEHLMRNEWKKDLQYTKLLVNSEYEIQTEFKVSSYNDELQEMGKVEETSGLTKSDWKEIKKREKKQKNKDEEINKEDNSPKEILTTNPYYNEEKDYWWAKNIPLVD